MTVMEDKQLAGCIGRTLLSAAEIDKTVRCKLHTRKIRAAVNLPALSEIFAKLKGWNVIK